MYYHELNELNVLNGPNFNSNINNKLDDIIKELGLETKNCD